MERTELYQVFPPLLQNDHNIRHMIWQFSKLSFYCTRVNGALRYNGEKIFESIFPPLVKSSSCEIYVGTKKIYCKFSLKVIQAPLLLI